MDWPVRGPWDGSTEGAFIESIADAMGWGILFFALLLSLPLVILLFNRVRRHRRLWCSQAGREVEVEFEEAGLSGFRHPVTVRSCSEFDPPTRIACRRRCLNSDVRVRLPMSPPIQWRF